MACTASRHGTESAYRQGCRCDSARNDRNHKLKLRAAGLHRPAYSNVTGTQRRLQALAAIGWATRDVAAQLGLPESTVKQARMGAWGQVRTDFADQIASLYEQLQGTPGASDRARTWAQKLGWAPPLAWDDGDLDDPAAQPTGVGAPPRQARVDLDEVRFLKSFGMSRDSVAGRLGVAPESIERAEYRALERTRAAVERARAAIRAATDLPAPEAEPTSSRELEHAR